MTEKIIIGIIFFVIGALMQLWSNRLLSRYADEDDDFHNEYLVYVTAGISFWFYTTGAKILIF